MKKVCVVVFTIVKVLLIVFLLAEAVYLGLCAYDVTIDNTFTLRKGSYGINPVWLADGRETPIDEFYDDMNGDIAVTTYRIYQFVCKKLMLSQEYGSRAKSLIKAWVGDSYEAAGISVEVTNNTSHQYEVAGIPELNANQKVYHSYTNSIYLTDCNQESLKGVLKSAIQFGDRGYYDGEKTFVQKGKLSVMNEGDEIFEWESDYSENKATAQRTYKDNDIKDIDNFIINRDTILAESCKIEREFSEEQNMYLYKVRFSLDCSSSGEGCATYYEVTAVKDLLGSFMKDMVYDKLDIELELYSNGYLLTRNLVQDWTIKVNLLGLEGHARSELNEVYNYKASECRIVNFTA